MSPWHLELILFCSWTIPVYTGQRNTNNVVFSANCNAYSLQCYLRCECRIVQLNELKSQAIYFSRRFRVPDNVQLNGRDIPLANKVTYLGVTFNRMTWTHHIERTVAKALRRYVKTY
jgi:hypothetical protein